MKRHEIHEQQWNRIKDKFPPEKKPQGGRPGRSNREMLNAILYWLNTGIPWRDLPERFGPWQSVYSRFRAWPKAGELLEPFDLNGKLILADKGYDSDKFVCWLKKRGGIAVIPSRITVKHPRKTDWHTYEERYLVENLFLKLKNNRRFATRYEKKALYFCAVVRLACILFWLL